jgi:molybdopterin synthase sulfur carrier subunit
LKVSVASVLFEYTGNRADLEARGATVAAVLEDLDRRYPGLRFRVVDEQDRLREHMNIFVGGRPTRDLDAKVRPDDEIHILQALSGG